MLNEGIMSKLKQGNISKDTEKTKTRVKEVWSPLKRPIREEILAIADLKQPTVERTYKLGSLSVKLVVAIAEKLNINPYYLTGESDEKMGCDDAKIARFLRGLGYDIADLPAEPESEDDEDDDEDFDGNFMDLFLEDPMFALTVMSDDLFECLSEEEAAAYEALTEEHVMAMMKGLIISAAINDEKKSVLSLIKYMLAN